MKRFTYVTPRSVSETVASLRKEAVPKAGGLDLLDRMKEGVSNPKRVVTLAAFEETDASSIHIDDKGAGVGAFVTLAEVAAHRGLRKLYPALADAAEEAATPQVRNQATVGGNLLQHPRCWYYRSSDFSCLRKGGDDCPAFQGENEFHAVLGYGRCPVVQPSSIAPSLQALGATVSVHAAEDRPIEQLWPDPLSIAPFRFDTLKPGEVLTTIHLPPPGANAYIEIRQKQSFDWALAQAAVAKAKDGTWRVVLGAVAPVPWRVPAAEKVLGRGNPTKALIAKAADVAVSDAKPLSKNGYKVKLARVALMRALEKAVGGPR